VLEGRPPSYGVEERGDQVARRAVADGGVEPLAEQALVDDVEEVGEPGSGRGWQGRARVGGRRGQGLDAVQREGAGAPVGRRGCGCGEHLSGRVSGIPGFRCDAGW
jgi:hypothetical protein